MLIEALAHRIEALVRRADLRPEVAQDVDGQVVVGHRTAPV